MTAQLIRIVYRVGSPENDQHHFTDQKEHADIAKNNGYEVSEYVLAGMDSKPVAWTSQRSLDVRDKIVAFTSKESADEYGSKSAWTDVVPVYAAPPAPVALPDVGREQFEAWVKFHLDDEHSIVTLHRANGGLNYRDPHVDLAWIAWKESRASMLQGAESAESRCTIQTVPALDSSPKNDESHSGNSTVIPDCSCRTCHPVTFTDSRFVVCPECGNKRCPRANDHRNACSGSNEPGQSGSAYPAAPEQEV